MGDFGVRKIRNARDRSKMYQFALKDIEAFEIMLRSGMIEKGPPMIGAEQELCLLNNNYNPATSALKVLEAIKDPRYTNELALFNLEINLDPVNLKNKCFSQIEKSLLALLTLGYKEVHKIDHHILMTGILPTLKFRHLQFAYMTPIPRYKTLSQALSDLRGTEFEIYLQGVDEIIMSLGSVLFEACNTSFQLHLQIHPDEFVAMHNWSQMIAGPVLSASVNSPLLFGNELWAETRIALFKQSLDTRSSQKYLRKKLPRVYFGDDWLQLSPSELWKNDIMRFPLIIASDDLKDPLSILSKGEVPDLRAIRLHNGTTYTWNRMCYGPSGNKPHLRIECRYLPSGPSVIDEMANFAFWIGLMKATPDNGPEFWKKIDFRNAKNNFIKAARTGLNSVFNWYGKNISARELILEKLLPKAQEGLEKCNVDHNDIQKYLTIIEKRVITEKTGSEWLIHNFRKLSKRHGRPSSEKALVHTMIDYQMDNIPVHEWDNVNDKMHSFALQKSTVEDLMSTDIFSINDEDNIELARSTLLWNNIHHLPVEDLEGNLVGLITDGIIERLPQRKKSQHLLAKDVMITNPVTIASDLELAETQQILTDHQISGLPVVHGKKLVGIITVRDFEEKGEYRE